MSTFARLCCVLLIPKNVRRRLDFAMALLRVLWMDAFRVILCTLAYFACLFVKVPLLEQVIDSCDDTERIVSAFLFLVASGAECLLNAYQNELSAICGCRLRAVLQGAIFKKMTLLSPSARAAISTGQVLSILGVDCYQLAMSIFNFPYPVCGLLCMPIMLYLLSCRVGAATPLCCAGYLLFVFLLPIPISRMQNFLWFRQMRARDERLKQTSDLLSSVRLVKMYAWEDAYKDKLLRARDVEMKPLFWVNVLDGLIDSIYSASSSVTSLSLKRIVEFCTEEEKEEDQVRSEDMILKHKGEVILSNCDFTWTKPTAGKTGAGLDDGRIAYVPQIANVHNMSVQCNILYGKRMHPKNYSRVLGACQLHQDVNTFPAGDLTEVGEKGETLSGGQKQRISLARAAYNQADVYLLDDPLSALDAVVSRKVFKEVIGKNGILRNKTRIMACNQGSFLDQMDKLVLVHNRGIIVYDTLADLLNDPRAPETLR
ncbi:unnamed protein product, partial [Ixodes pacificus]